MVVSCKNTEVPHNIKTSFLDIEPTASKIHWSIDEDIYRVKYQLKSKTTTSYFDIDGNWLETEYEINTKELPEAILKTLEEKLSEYSIVDIELVKTKEHPVLYEVDLKKNNKFYDILFDKTGKILRKKI